MVASRRIDFWTRRTLTPAARIFLTRLLRSFFLNGKKKKEKEREKCELFVRSLAL